MLLFFALFFVVVVDFLGFFLYFYNVVSVSCVGIVIQPLVVGL
jgi:hypothetical protein